MDVSLISNFLPLLIKLINRFILNLLSLHVLLLEQPLGKSLVPDFLDLSIPLIIITKSGNKPDLPP